MATPIPTNRASFELGAIAWATGGELRGGQPEHRVTGVAIDSRAVQQGGLFVAIRGDNQDGARFIPSAVAAGASCLLVQRGTDCPDGVPRVEVADTTRALGDLAESDPTARSVTLMAAIEKGEGAADAVVRGWLAKALTVSRGPQWICENCQHIHSDWAPFCENCESFDTLAWKTPPMTEMAMPGGVQMLPLIVGALEDKSDLPVSATEPEIEDAELVTDEEPEVVEGVTQEEQTPKAS